MSGSHGTQTAEQKEVQSPQWYYTGRRIYSDNNNKCITLYH